MRMMQHPFFNSKQILVVDALEGERQQKTWCFWEQEPGLFEPVVLHSWDRIDFYAPSFSRCFTLAPYTYKMIRSDDFYRYVRAAALQQQNIHWVKETVQVIGNENGRAFIETKEEKREGLFLFNSISFGDFTPQRNKHYLLQHFKGWMIETEQPVFDAAVARFMDFRVSQENGTSFLYVLPVTARKALVEYTLFSPALLTQRQYDIALEKYINEMLHPGAYTIVDTETGVIPMTNHRFLQQEENIIHIGTVGGDTKGSTGYTFRFIQKRTERIVAALIKGESPTGKSSWLDQRFGLYDSTLLHVLAGDKMEGSELFAQLFRKNTPQKLFRFLDNETSLTAELPIIASMPASVFLPALVKEFLL
jgi:lycopene beta-cyclase